LQQFIFTKNGIIIFKEMT